MANCPVCNDSGKTIHADGQQSAYLDCSCPASTERRELNEAAGAFAIINRDDMDCDWFIHQRAKALGRAEALAELHPQWLAEKERADRAEARIADLEAQFTDMQARLRAVFDLLCAWETGAKTGDELADALFSMFASTPAIGG